MSMAKDVCTCLLMQSFHCSLLVSAQVKMPSGKIEYPKIEDNRDGTVTVRYQPTETGLHELHVMYNNEAIEGQSRFVVISLCTIVIPERLAGTWYIVPKIVRELSVMSSWYLFLLPMLCSAVS